MADVKNQLNLTQSRLISELHQEWRNYQLPSSLKILLYPFTVCSSLTHAYEAWERMIHQQTVRNNRPQNRPMDCLQGFLAHVLFCFLKNYKAPAPPPTYYSPTPTFGSRTPPREVLEWTTFTRKTPLFTSSNKARQLEQHSEKHDQGELINYFSSFWWYQ